MNQNRIKGYLVDKENKILGEVKNFDSYSRKGDIKFYDVPTVEFAYGYLPQDLNIMSELEIQKDDRLRKELEMTQYETWKNRHITRLLIDYDKLVRDSENFDRFCRDVYKMVNEGGD